jgi:CHRD domain
MGKRVIAAAALGFALAVVGVASGAGASTVVSARLTPAAETTKGSAGGSGTAVITLNVKTRKACWKLSVKGIDKPLSAHVHQAAKGKDGPVVIPLGARFAATGCVIVPLQKKTKANPHPVDVLAAVAKHPSSYYVNVHTKKYLNGAIRGQLKLGR